MGFFLSARVKVMVKGESSGDEVDGGVGEGESKSRCCVEGF